jgi:hypothetical protein
MYLPKGAVRTPGKNWVWVSEWQIQANTHKEFYLIRENSKNIDHDGSYDPEGWQYSLDFTKSFSGSPSMSALVRRRKWVRTCMKQPDSANAKPNEGTATLTQLEPNKKSPTRTSSVSADLN